MATRIQKYVSWDNHILIIRPCAGGNTVLGSITSPCQGLSSSLISAFLGFIFIGNLETTAATRALKLLLKTWLSLGFLSRSSSALNPNHRASTPLSVRTGAFLSQRWATFTIVPLTPPSPQHRIHREQGEGGWHKFLSGSYYLLY